MKTTTSSTPFLNARWRGILSDMMFIMPALLIFALFFAYPVSNSFYISLTKWNGLKPELKFVGFANFIKLWNDRHFWSALRNTFKYAIIVTTVQNMLGLVLALAASNRAFRHFRVLFLIPPLLSSIALGSIWKYMYAPNGAINSMLTSFGLSTYDWLGDPDLALYSLIITNV
ncbi:MAG: sugar ABC transporter permease, partial [Methylococcales bacterium]|nr:sugar ABC transporter permease [Methylococcales bacterium]